MLGGCGMMLPYAWHIEGDLLTMLALSSSYPGSPTLTRGVNALVPVK